MIKVLMDMEDKLKGIKKSDGLREESKMKKVWRQSRLS